MKCQALVLRLYSRMLAPLARHTFKACAIWGTKNTDTATCSRDSGSAASGRRSTMLASSCGCGARRLSRCNKCRFCWFTRSSMPLASARVIAYRIMEAWTGTFAQSSSHHVYGFVWMVVAHFHWACVATGSRRSGIGRKASSPSPSISQVWSKSGPRCASPSSPSTCPSLLHGTRMTTSCPWWCGP